MSVQYVLTKRLRPLIFALMETRSTQLQIRVTPGEKAALKRLARAAGQDVSAYVLARALPERGVRFRELIGAVADESTRRFALAELSDLLASLAPAEFAAATESADVRGLTPAMANYVAALTEQGAAAANVPPPPWTRDVVPLDEPYFATPLRSLHSYLLRISPVAFRRRNVFTDGGLGART